MDYSLEKFLIVQLVILWPTLVTGGGEAVWVQHDKLASNIMKKFFIILCLAVCALCSCTKEAPDSGNKGTFTLIGKWGMVSGTITDKNGNTTRYDEYEGFYYQYLEFKASGSLVRTTNPDGTITQGVYSFNDATRGLSYKYDGDMYYLNAMVSVISPTEMNMTTDYGTAGRITQHFRKVTK